LYGWIINFEHKALIVFFIVAAAYCFQIVGGILAAFFGWSIHTIQDGEIDFFFLSVYLFIGLCMVFFTIYFNRKKLQQDEWREIVIRNSKQLNILKEVSAAIQDTRELDKILQIIATSVTAGHGLGFNRAMILLVNEVEDVLHGVIGVGPMTAEEGYRTWENIAEKKYGLDDLIELQETDKLLDLKLNEHVKNLLIDISNENFLAKVLHSGEPTLINSIDITDDDQLMLTSIFNLEEFVVFPLINQTTQIGVLILDNPVSKKKITTEDIDSVIPIANQAAIAIQQSHLYTQIEDMALRDGLTGLMNHRSFQMTLEKIFPTNEEEELSFIMIDIDAFKQYNDTNGHLLGNHVLYKLANIMKDSIRNIDFSFRFGGEEFVVLLPHTSIDIASMVAERIRKNVEDTQFPQEKSQPDNHLTISLGVASTKHLAKKTVDNLIETADLALYQAKGQGRNKVVTFKEMDNDE
jgi:diguanylate cyclase (GGDEF)-like protein